MKLAGVFRNVQKVELYLGHADDVDQNIMFEQSQIVDKIADRVRRRDWEDELEELDPERNCCPEKEKTKRERVIKGRSISGLD